MAYAYYINGVKFNRRCLIRLSADERERLLSEGRAELKRAVEWPLPDRVPDFDRAYCDPGGSLWGPGPYLKVPNYDPGDDEESVNRVFCPWGYPPYRLRIAHKRRYLQIQAVESCPGR